MHRDFLGDGKDFAKGYVLRLMRGDGELASPDLLGQLLVFPMFSDEGCLKSQGFLESYHRILGGRLTFLSTHRLWGGADGDRDRFLSAANDSSIPADQPHTLFLDPDTGVMEDDESGAGRKRVRKRDLAYLFEANRDHVVIVFDDSYSFSGAEKLGHDEEAHRIEVLRSALSKKLCDVDRLAHARPLTTFGYIGMSVNLLFLASARGAHRLTSMEERLGAMLGDSAKLRVVPYRGTA